MASFQSIGLHSRLMSDAKAMGPIEVDDLPLPTIYLFRCNEENRNEEDGRYLYPSPEHWLSPDPTSPEGELLLKRSVALGDYTKEYIYHKDPGFGSEEIPLSASRVIGHDRGGREALELCRLAATGQLSADQREGILDLTQTRLGRYAVEYCMAQIGGAPAAEAPLFPLFSPAAIEALSNICGDLGPAKELYDSLVRPEWVNCLLEESAGFTAEQIRRLDAVAPSGVRWGLVVQAMLAFGSDMDEAIELMEQGAIDVLEMAIGLRLEADAPVTVAQARQFVDAGLSPAAAGAFCAMSDSLEQALDYVASSAAYGEFIRSYKDAGLALDMPQAIAFASQGMSAEAAAFLLRVCSSPSEALEHAGRIKDYQLFAAYDDAGLRLSLDQAISFSSAGIKVVSAREWLKLCDSPEEALEQAQAFADVDAALVSGYMEEGLGLSIAQAAVFAREEFAVSEARAFMEMADDIEQALEFAVSSSSRRELIAGYHGSGIEINLASADVFAEQDLDVSTLRVLLEMADSTEEALDYVGSSSTRNLVSLHKDYPQLNLAQCSCFGVFWNASTTGALIGLCDGDAEVASAWAIELRDSDESLIVAYSQASLYLPVEQVLALIKRRVYVEEYQQLAGAGYMASQIVELSEADRIAILSAKDN